MDKLMRMVKNFRLHPVPLFAMLGIGLPAYAVVHSCGCHQVALVCGVNKHAAAVYLAGKTPEIPYMVALHLHPSRTAVEPFIAYYPDFMLPHEVLEYPLCHMGLKDPHRSRFAIECHRALTPVSELLQLLPFPGGILPVMTV